MSVISEIQTKLAAQGTFGTLVRGHFPQEPNVIGVLFEYGGIQPTRGFGVAGLKYEEPSFQLVFRGEPFDYDGPRAKAESAYLFLAAIQPGQLGNGVTTEYLMITPKQSPHPVRPMDTNNRHYIGINFRAHKVPS
jgi:hypothetical protein